MTDKPDDLNDHNDLPLPPPSFLSLITMLGSQAMLALGLVPVEQAGRVIVRINEAKHFIDLIEILREKTEGNRTQEETEAIDGFLHELRMAYITLKGGPTEQAEKDEPAKEE